MLGQFIPQPNAYNPDVNGDSFIGVDDVIGTLAVYDNEFDNADSIVIQTINYPQDIGLYNGTQNNPTSIVVQEDWDIVYFNEIGEGNTAFYLPEGNGYRVLQIFLKCSDTYDTFASFYGPYQLAGSGETPLRILSSAPAVVTFIRGHDGTWYAAPIPRIPQSW